MEYKQNKAKSETLEWIKFFVISISIAILVRIFIFEFVIVEQSSMFPTLAEGDKLCNLKVAYLFSDVKYADIVIIKIDESKNYVKRVIAGPLDTIEIKNSKVYLNDKLLKEDYLVPNLIYNDYPKTLIPVGYYFVMGDNRGASLDSRGLGFIKESDILGKIIFRISPFTVFKNEKVVY